MKSEKLLDIILDRFPVDVSSTEPINIRGLRQDTRVFRVNPGKSPLIPGEADVGNVYIIDSVSGMKIACHPHIVGDSLDGLCLDCAREFLRALVELGLYEDEGSVVLHILRGAAGYKVDKVLPKGTPIIRIRTEYVADSYRLHLDESKDIVITFRDYSAGVSRMDELSTLLIPDTFATGRSAETALNDLFESGLKPRQIVLYGFIAIPALVKLGSICSDNDIELFSFSICDITQLAQNNYDMPLYGLDESFYVSTGDLRHLGSIVNSETLKDFLPSYVAGLDQPGDWSERQTTLFNGHRDEEGGITGHLRKSIRFMESLREINVMQPWYEDYQDSIALRELDNLRASLGKCE